MEIKDRIKEVRTAVGISQPKFAKRIAIAPSHISEVERGVREISERTIRLIIAEFNVNEDWLRTGQGSMFKEDVSASVSEAMSIFKALAPNLQDSALKMLAVFMEMNNSTKTLSQ